MLREDFGTLQKWRKGANTKTWNVMWGKRRTNVGTDGDDGGNVYGQRSVDGNVIVYVYILSMVKRCLSGKNTHSTKIFLRARRWTAIGVGAYRDHTAIDPLSTARDPTSTKRRAVFFTARLFLYHRITLFTLPLLTCVGIQLVIHPHTQHTFYHLPP